MAKVSIRGTVHDNKSADIEIQLEGDEAATFLASPEGNIRDDRAREMLWSVFRRLGPGELSDHDSTVYELEIEVT